jgi:hypothetical protein
MDAPQNEKKKNDDRQRNADQKKEKAPFHGFLPGSAKRVRRSKREAAPAAAVKKGENRSARTAPKRGKFLPARSVWVARSITRYFDVGQTEKTCMSAFGT